VIGLTVPRPAHRRVISVPFPFPFHPFSFILPFNPRLCLHLDMITLESPASSPQLPTLKPSLADLSRNASAISSSSSSSSTTSLVLPYRPRPIRTFSSPRSRSPGGPPTPKASRPPAYITRELGIADQSLDMLSGRSRANSKSKSRSSSANGRLSADDFEFGDVLGEGSYSTVRLMPLE
jgi:3-phosphoinositide dependent protein kinase-1